MAYKDEAIHVSNIGTLKLDNIITLKCYELFEYNSFMRQLKTDLKNRGLNVKQVLIDEVKKTDTIYYKIIQNELPKEKI